jgi:hypothetical protein
MRTNTCSLPAATALLLAASAALVSGCTCRAPAQFVFRDPITVYAVIEYDGKTATMKTSQGFEDKKLIRISEKFHDTIHWLSASGEVHIVKWTPTRPFENDPTHENKVLKSGHPAPGTHVQRHFAYEAELWLDPDGKNRVKIDPSIEVME